MLHKCANPDCENTFRQLNQGKLFLVETGPALASNARNWRSKLSRQVEHFWLCDRCAQLFTLSFEKGRGIMIVPLSKAPVKMPLKNASSRDASAGMRGEPAVLGST